MARESLSVHVEGIPELQRALRRMQEGTPKVIQGAMKEVAEIVVAEAKRNAGSANLAARIDARGTVKGAMIRFRGHKPKGKSKTTDWRVQEFGGRAPLFGDRNHWYEVKPRNRKGWIIYPAIRSTRQQVMDAVLPKLDEALRLYWQQRSLGG